MRRDPSQNALLLVGVSPWRKENDAKLTSLITCFEHRGWPIAFVTEPGIQLSLLGRPYPSDLLIQTHCVSLTREPCFINLYRDFGEPKVALAGDWENILLIGTLVDSYLSGFTFALAADACNVVSSMRIEPLSKSLRELLGDFSFSLKASDLHETQHRWWV